MRSQTGGKRVAAATACAPFQRYILRKRIPSGVERNDLLPLPPLRCGTGGRTIGGSARRTRPQSRRLEFTPASYKNQDYSINIDWLDSGPTGTASGAVPSSGRGRRLISS